MMSQHHDLVATSALVPYSLQLLLLMSRHQDVVATLLHVFCSLNCWSGCRDITSHVATSASWIASFNQLFLVSRHQSSCRDIILCCCRLYWLFMMSRLQPFCRDIALFKLCSFLSCLCFAPCRDLHQFPFNLPDVATSELDCLGLKAA